MELVRLCPTVFPIIFATIASRFYKNVARWRLESQDGIKLAALEQTFGSQSFAAVAKQLFSIRTQKTLGVIILCTWIMSPLGGQSSSRMLSVESRTATANTPIYYLNPPYQRPHVLFWPDSESDVNQVKTLYTFNLLCSTAQQQAQRDPWHLPKIPQWPRDAPVEGTYNVNATALTRGEELHSSFLGIGIQGLDYQEPNTYYEFSIETSYVDLDCTQVAVVHLQEIAWGLTDVRFQNEATKAAVLRLKTKIFAVFDGRGYGASETFVIQVLMPVPWDQWKNLRDPPLLHMLYISQVADTQASIVDCTMKSMTLETTIRCPSTTSCAAVKQRRIHSQSANQPFQSMQKNPAALQRALERWSQATASTTPTQQYLTPVFVMGIPVLENQDNAFWDNFGKQWPTNFSRRLTTAFNTFWELTLEPEHNYLEVTTQPRPNDLRLDPENFWNNTVGTVTKTLPGYQADRLWLDIFLAIAIFLEVLAILGLVLEAMILGPDVLGFASTATRDSAYVPLPPGGSRFSGPERARQLRDLRLQLADVRPEDETGYLTIRALPERTNRYGTEEGGRDEESEQTSDSLRWRPLDRKRLYT